MTFFKHTESWFKGEAFEAGMLIIFGVLLVILALYFWKFGHSPTARALIIPLLLVGAFWSVVPAAGLYRNAARVEAYRAECQNNPSAFVETEKKRVEAFFKWYRPLLIGWTVIIIVGLALFHLWGGNLGRAVGLAVIFFGVAGLLVDHTSEHNAKTYYSEIVRAAES